jgi:hypothetical protein
VLPMGQRHVAEIEPTQPTQPTHTALAPVLDTSGRFHASGIY